MAYHTRNCCLTYIQFLETHNLYTLYR